MAKQLKASLVILLLAFLLLVHPQLGKAADDDDDDDNGKDLPEQCPKDTSPNVIYYNTGKTKEGSVFMTNLGGVYQTLLQRTPGSSMRSFSHQQGKQPNKVFGFGACFAETKDGDCTACLDTIKGHFSNSAALAVGARMCLKNTGSEYCYLRYENYSFGY